VNPDYTRVAAFSHLHWTAVRSNCWQFHRRNHRYLRASCRRTSTFEPTTNALVWSLPFRCFV